jgi:ABC-type bacteriocin/lantibiotic exporter with double-glycine peptidase domain
LGAPAALLALVFAAQAGTRLDVPFVRQEKNGCGSAALSMVIEYWQRNGAAVPPGAAGARAIQQELYSAEASGIYASDLVNYLERIGFRAFTFRGAWADLADHLAKGRPLIVSLGHSRLHYVVVAGLDPERELVYINDPAERKLMKLDRASFERAWKERWTLLAVPRRNE